LGGQALVTTGALELRANCLCVQMGEGQRRRPWVAAHSGQVGGECPRVWLPVCLFVQDVMDNAAVSSTKVRGLLGRVRSCWTGALPAPCL
jgi:hypothetical protein